MAKNNPLDGKTQAEIDIVMSKRLKDMDQEEMRIYKRVKYDAWILKNPERAPKKKDCQPKKLVKETEKDYQPIKFVQEIEEQEEDKPKIPFRSGKIPKWTDIPELNDKQKEWSENRQALVSFDGVTKICKINWLQGEEMPTATCDGVKPFFLSWPMAYCSVKYGFVHSYEQNAIIK